MQYEHRHFSCLRSPFDRVGHQVIPASASDLCTRLGGGVDRQQTNSTPPPQGLCEASTFAIVPIFCPTRMRYGQAIAVSWGRSEALSLNLRRALALLASCTRQASSLVNNPSAKQTIKSKFSRPEHLSSKIRTDDGFGDLKKTYFYRSGNKEIIRRCPS